MLLKILLRAGDFFDQQSHHGDLRLTYDPDSFIAGWGWHAYRSRDVISYAVPARPDIFPSPGFVQT